MSFSNLNVFVFSGGIAFLGLMLGCGGPSAKSMMAKAADNDMKKLGALYLQFQSQNTKDAWIGPESEDEFKDFIRQQNPEGLEFLGVDVERLDDMFVGDRDNKPLKVRWGVQGFARGPAVPVFFEQDGVDGKFMVGFNGFVVKEVDKSEYDRMWSGETDNPDEGA